ncbi:MAG TPA: hypothetical protein VNN55_12090 [bacterium]|nr:hypothetical protein [bacterium]
MILFLGLAIFAGCDLQSPKSPQWTVDLAVPLANRHIDGPYLAAHDGTDYLRWSNDSGLVWSVCAVLAPVYVSEHLKFTVPAQTGSASLGSVTVGAGTSVEREIALGELTPLAAGEVPEFATQIAATFPDAPGFDTVGGASGDLVIQIENALGLTLDQVTVHLNAGGHPVAIVPFPDPIAPGQTASRTVTLAGLSVGNDWDFTLEVHTPGGTILSAADKYLRLSASLPNGVRAVYARGIVAPSASEQSDSLRLSDTHLLSSAELAAGQLTLSWRNHTPLPVTVAWSSPELLRDGVPLSGLINFAPGAEHTQIIDLSGTVYTGGATRSYAAVNLTVQTTGSDGQIIEVSDADQVEFALAASEWTLASASGQIAPTEFATGTQSAGFEWEDGLDAAGLDGWEAYLRIESSLPLAAQFNGTVTSNTGLVLPFAGTVPARVGNQPTVTRLPLVHGAIPLWPLPGQVACAGTVTLGGETADITITAADFIRAGVEFAAPAHLYVDDVQLDLEPTAIDLTSDDYGDRTDRLMAATVTVTIQNRFPVGGEFVLRAAADSMGVDEDGALRFGPSTVAPAATDAQGFAVAPVTTVLNYELNREQLALFERDRIWFAESLRLVGPGAGTPARIAADDVMDWHAAARMVVKLDGDVRPWED